MTQIGKVLLNLAKTATFRRNSINTLHRNCYYKRQISDTLNFKIHCLYSYSTVKKNFKCWKCGVEKESPTELFCSKCNFIQEPHETDDYFKVLNYDVDFNVDQKSLTQRYRQLQTLIHPDKFSNRSDQERTISEDYSALLNRAYTTLQNPLSRAVHILHLKGEHIAEDYKLTDPSFLLEIMELNEKVENVKNTTELKNLNKMNKDTLEQLGREISSNLKADNVKKVKDLVIKMKYYNSVDSYINNVLREKGVVD